ncbi:MAG TPA: winged helix-turn-helix domain-containing protein [Aliiroseovarius sp.]|nr:winged helix-turn-helix domain-containing protein [Aliiroseovarius sp.]
MTRPLEIPNRAARALWLASNALTGPRRAPGDIAGLIHDLGFVQIDTIRNVTRAHNHILWSRIPRYREGAVWHLLRDRVVFEHYTHDASLISAHVLPFWQGQFQRLGQQAARSEWFQSGLGRAEIAAIRDRIAAEGPLSTHAFDTKIEGAREMWARPPHKKALDQMWYAGELATAHREKFVKFYDLGSRVFPPDQDHPAPGDAARWLNEQALARLGFATAGEVKRFWDAVDSRAVRHWTDSAAGLVAVRVQAADGSWQNAHAPADIETRLATRPTPGSRMRLLNPFDPVVRDRARLERLFGFEYRNEMFVPAAKRRWGYYVYPLLEGLRFVGRIELKANRKQNLLMVTGFWPEAGVKWPVARRARLDAELARFARFAGLDAIHWQAGAS